MIEFVRKLLGLSAGADALPPPGRGGAAELARRLGVRENELRAVPVGYNRFTIPKRSGGTRTILAPQPELKQFQRRILHRLLRRLEAHPCATGFERRHSIVTHALPHVGREVVIRLDLRDFFASISAQRVEGYFRTIGWDAEAAGLLTHLCTHEGSLPQGAPTSPRLSNLVNYRLDARLAALAARRGAAYSRYADDITFSFSPTGGPERANDLIHAAKQILDEEEYALHTKKKLRIARQHDRQLVTGLVVNHRPNLPRSTRRRLRAVRHHLATGRNATLSPAQLAGWEALERMIANQAAG